MGINTSSTGSPAVPEVASKVVEEVTPEVASKAVEDEKKEYELPYWNKMRHRTSGHAYGWHVSDGCYAQFHYLLFMRNPKTGETVSKCFWSDQCHNREIVKSLQGNNIFLQLIVGKPRQNCEDCNTRLEAR